MGNSIILIILIILIWYVYKQHHETDPIIKISKDKYYTIDTGRKGPCIGIIAGVHGNERSGPIELLSLIENGTLMNIKRGKLKIIPCANVNGFRRNLRWRNWFFNDLNRTFDKNDKQVEDIITYFSDCDVVIDFHEAWGWHLIDNNSTGNTIVPINCAETAKKILNDVNNNPVVAKINLKNPNKKFTLGEKYVICKFSGTLSCWMHKHGRQYMLVEVAGQNDIQPLSVRREIVRTVVLGLLDHEEM